MGRRKGWIRYLGTRSLRDGPRWLFLATVIYAPWAYGCTTAGTIVVLNWLLGVVLASWLAGCVVTRQSPIIPSFLAVLVAELLLLGWWMVLNAHSVFDSDFFVFVSLRPLASFLPGSIDRLISVAAMLRVTTVLGVACFVADLSTRREWLLRLWMTVALAGGSIALLGLLQKATHAHMIFWESAFISSERDIPFFF